MNIKLRQNPSQFTRFGGGRNAFTFPELMIATAVFVLVIAGNIAVQIFGMRYDELVCSKLGASEQSRMSFQLLSSDIRASKIWRIGNGNQTTFTNLPNATLQQGNALQLCLTTDTNAWIRYYFETNGPFTAEPNGRLCRVTSANEYDILAQNLTNVTANSMTFYGEDYRGVKISDYNYRFVVVAFMEFCQYQYPRTYVGPGYYYDYYRIVVKCASHCPN
jgi:hypothetical protein